MTSIAFAAPSLIRSSEEQAVVLDAIQTLSSYGLPIIIVDGGSSEKDKKTLQQIPHVIFFEEHENLMKQLVTAHTQAARHADYIFYLQSDKPDFAKDVVPRMIHYYETLDQKGLLIPSRTPESLQTYPHFQKEQEAFLNFFISDYVGISQDYFAGPKILPKELITYTKHITENIGWGLESFFYVLAKRLAIPFDFLSCFITAPQDIEEAEKTKLYRLLGTKWQIEGLLKAHHLPL